MPASLGLLWAFLTVVWTSDEVDEDDDDEEDEEDDDVC